MDIGQLKAEGDRLNVAAGEKLAELVEVIKVERTHQELILLFAESFKNAQQG